MANYSLLMKSGVSDAGDWAPYAPDTAAVPAVFQSIGPHGHRKRMRERVLGRGAATIADYEVLEMLLFYGISRGDTKPLAKATINRFGSLPAVLRAGADALLATPGITAKCAEAIALVRETAACIACAEARDARVLSNWQALGAYLATCEAAPLRVLYLDNKNRLLADETGPGAGASLDTQTQRAILTRALELNSVSLLLASHRTDPNATRADRDALVHLRRAGAAVAVGLHDFVLMSDDEVVSVQQLI
jgi:DNA repair protein RadC